MKKTIEYFKLPCDEDSLNYWKSKFNERLGFDISVKNEENPNLDGSVSSISQDKIKDIAILKKFFSFFDPKDVIDKIFERISEDYPDILLELNMKLDADKEFKEDLIRHESECSGCSIEIIKKRRIEIEATPKYIEWVLMKLGILRERIQRK